ncbi:Xylose isomerase-like TIM barrel [compost metagenome]
MQSLLFGQSHLNLFSTVESRNQMLDYLSGIISLAGNLGVKTLVFGSPKNRLVGKLSYKERMEIAAPFFYQLGSFAVKNNVTLCIEPNPIHYGCDFITNTEEALGLIREVNHPGFQLHLDSGALELNDENIYTVIEHSMPYLKHFHISEPYLNLIGSGQTKHREIAIALRSLGYENWISIEMKNSVSPSNIESVERALDYTLETYVQRGAY